MLMMAAIFRILVYVILLSLGRNKDQANKLAERETKGKKRKYKSFLLCSPSRVLHMKNVYILFKKEDIFRAFRVHYKNRKENI